MTEHRHVGRLDRAWEWAKRNVIAILIVGFVLLGLASALYAVSQAVIKARQDQKIEKDQRCLVQLQQLITDRANALQKIQDDDRAALHTWIARVSADVKTGDQKDIAAAYEAYRADVSSNDAKRVQYGAGIQVAGACSFRQLAADIQHPPGPLPSTSLTSSPPRSSELPPLPVIITRTVAITVGVPGPTHIVQVPGPERTVTVTRSRGPKPRVTVTKTVTVTPKPSVICIIPPPAAPIPPVCV